METLEQLKDALRQALKPSLCRFATQQDYIDTILEVRDILEEIKHIKELN